MQTVRIGIQRFFPCDTYRSAGKTICFGYRYLRNIRKRHCFQIMVTCGERSAILQKFIAAYRIIPSDTYFIFVTSLCNIAVFAGTLQNYKPMPRAVIGIIQRDNIPGTNLTDRVINFSALRTVCAEAIFYIVGAIRTASEPPK